jgi:hypothetical protein
VPAVQLKTMNPSLELSAASYLTWWLDNVVKHGSQTLLDLEERKCCIVSAVFTPEVNHLSA